jgi:hypothetical protein
MMEMKGLYMVSFLMREGTSSRKLLKYRIDLV